MRLDELNALDAEAAERELLRCCGSTRWVREMTAARPFASAEATADTGDAIWSSLDRAEWLEAFAAHLRIGDRTEAPAATPSGTWSAQEQAGVASASDDVREQLAERNRDYEARLGYIFIVCATGKSADDMLAALERRLTNDPNEELRIAADEQRKIMRLRLAKLLEAPAPSASRG